MKKLIFTISILGAMTLALMLDSTSTYSNPSGAPERCSGSPGDGETCANSNCHNGTASARDGMITSDIPTSGYIPGTLYTITVSITQSGVTRWGFALSPQTQAGNVIGTLAVSNTTQTQLKSSGNYITHKTAGNSGSGTKSWSMHWTAPTAGTGDVPFYASVMAANGNGNENGDATFFDVYTVSEDITTSVNSAKAEKVKFSVYPNPIEGNEANVIFSTNMKEISKIQILSLNGELVKEINYVASSSGKQQLTIPFDELSKGVYLLQVQTAEGVNSSRIIRR